MNSDAVSIRGVLPALVTPFVSSASASARDVPAIDWDSWERQIEWQIECGVHGLVIFGTTGESATLSNAEKIELSKRTVSQVAGRVPVIAGTGNNNTAESIRFTQEVAEQGVDAALAVTPYYNKPSQSGLRAHFTALADEGGLPLIVYNVPGRTVTSIAVETFAELASHANIIACKQAVDSISELVALSAAIEGRMSLLAGDDAIFHSVLCNGGRGVISATAAAFPKEMIAIWDAYSKGDAAQALGAQQALLPAINALFSETNPVPAKAALKIRGIIADDAVRLPLVKATEVTNARLAALL